MDLELKERFTALWQRHFAGAELPLALFYAEEPDVERAAPTRAWRCFIAGLIPVRRGTPLAFDVDALGCDGVKRYAGFKEEIFPGINHFLSCGIPGKLEGERYKKSPQLVELSMANTPCFAAPAAYLVAKRWDALGPGDAPEVIVFFARPDVLSGLVVLASYDRPDDNGVAAPFVAGCSSILARPYAEREAERPRAFVGMFDPSARPFVDPNELTFAVSFGRFCQMVDDLPECFVIGPAWRRLSKRFDRAGKP